jgi:CRP-like cAMP-binding protein
MDSKLIKSLARQPLFKGTPEDVLAKVAEQVTIRHLADGEILICKDDPSDSLFIIRRGWLKVLGEGSGGEEIILNHLGPGQIVGEMSVIDKMPRSNTVAALKEAELMEIKYDTILDVLNRHPVLAISLLQEMSGRVRFANAYIQETVQWCQQIAGGNYDFVKAQVEQTQSTVVDVTQSDQARAGAFLSSFFKMVEGVQQREDELKQQVQQLIIQIDEAKRQQSVQELTDSNFFADLKATAQKLRQERKDRKKD